MKVLQTRLPGVVIVEPTRHGDDRGFFAEVYHRARFLEHGLGDEFVQDNQSRSIYGVLRGLHFQDMTAPMVKLVRCTHGLILDVVVDLRVGSPSFGQWVAVELSADNLRMLWAPVGFGHGFVTLSPVADVHYRCSAYYAPDAERAVAWNDPDLAIEWPIEHPILSARDRRAMSLQEYLRAPSFRMEVPEISG